MNAPLTYLAEVLQMRRPRWMDDAACRDAKQDLFFPEVGESADAAKRLCAECPVRAECLAWGLHEDAGIFGGMNRKAREKLAAGGWQAGDPLPPIKLQAFAVQSLRVKREAGDTFLACHGTEGGFAEHRRRAEKVCPVCAAWQERRRAMQRRTSALRAARAAGGAA